MGKRTLAVIGVAVWLLAGVVPAQEERPEQGDVSDSAPAPSVPDAGDIATIPVEEPPPPLDSGPAQLDEVVVTAQKVKQPLRKVPVSVTTYDGEFIQATGAADLADISLYVPNARVDADDLGSPQVFIRGFGTNSFNPSFEGSVAFVQDEIYFGRPGYFTESMFDVDRLEVLRGPQGTLFGKNSVAGVFNVTSRGPENEIEADARYFYGETDEHRLEAGVGGMFNDWIGGRVAGLYRHQNGDLYNQYLDRYEEELEQTAGRVKLRVTPLGGLASELTVASSETAAPFWPFQLMQLDDDTRAYLEGFDPNIEDDPYDYNTSFDTQGWIDKGSDTVGLTTAYELGELWGLTELTPVLVLGGSQFHIDQLNEVDVSPADIARLDNHEQHEQKSAELRFAGQANSLFGFGTGLQFVAGGFYFDSSYTLLAKVLAGKDLASWLITDDAAQLITGDRSATGGPASPGGVLLGALGGTIFAGDHYRFDYTQDVRSMAGFGQVTWNITERWAITPGVRINREHKEVATAGVGHCTQKDEGGAGEGSCAMEIVLETRDYAFDGLTRDETDVSPKLAIQYFAPFDVNFYASYAKGYKSGGFNSISFGRQCDDPNDDTSCRTVRADELEYEPEEARTYEAGFKARFFERTLDLNVTGYKTDFDNLQVLAFNGVFFDVSNAGQAESQGLELDFRWLSPWQPLRFMGAFGLLDAKYKKYPGAPAPIAEGIGQQQDLAGKRIAFAPKATGSLTPVLTFLFGDYLATFSGDVLYQGDQYTDTDLDPNTHVDAYLKYTARVMFGPATQKWGVAVGGSNLTDERVLNQVTDAPFFPGTYFAQEASGRQLFATVSYGF